MPFSLSFDNCCMTLKQEWDIGSWWCLRELAMTTFSSVNVLSRIEEPDICVCSPLNWKTLFRSLARDCTDFNLGFLIFTKMKMCQLMKSTFSICRNNKNSWLPSIWYRYTKDLMSSSYLPFYPLHNSFMKLRLFILINGRYEDKWMKIAVPMS